MLGLFVAITVFNCLFCDLQEYDCLTNKIHELQLKEQELQEQLSNERASPPPAVQLPLLPSEGDHQNHDTPILTPNSSSGNLPGSLPPGIPSGAGPVPALVHSAPSNNPPRSPMKTMVKALLPNQQKTAVSSFQHVQCSAEILRLKYGQDIT